MTRHFHQSKFTVTVVASLILATLVSLWPAPVDAQRPRLSFIRDAEIEALVADYAKPLMRAANLRKGSVRFYIVSDNSFNAFVSGSGMFINTGLLLQAEDPSEVIGVVAHELGHIVGGHQVRLRERIENASRIARWTSLLGLGLGAAGALSGSNDLGRAGFGIASSGGSLALRDVLRYQRDEETSADRIAVNLLRQTKQSGKGMLDTFRRLSRNTNILSGRIDPYLMSHPTPNERIATLRTTIRKSPFFNRKTSGSLKKRHDMVRAKIAAYVGGNRYASSVLADKKLHPDARLYGQAILAHLYGSPKRAIPLIDKLLKRNPKNAYVNEMKGEILLRSGKPRQAIAPFRKAVQYDRTGAGFIRVELGHALLESGSKNNLDEAIRELQKGLSRDPTAVQGYQYLAIAYGRKGQTARALLASADFALRTGKKARAKDYARRAKRGFKRGTPGWLRAEDIITVK
ncbi:MAG: M48 family metalloprotease [Rhizobiaceae bacterium]